ncbi:MAG: HNH endonuclease [Planctomycetes bacterium]|nr:HNH endonuclease [Planctomycetota bacterium]
MPYKPPTFKPYGASTPAPKRKTEASRLRNTARWQKFRAWYRKRFPLCCDPFRDHASKGQGAATAHIHHVEPIETRPDLLCDPANCRSVCSRCHGRLNSMERSGQGTKHLLPPQPIKPSTIV